MKLRYDFRPSQKTYRTFPQKVVHSTGLADRWSFLRWCCPFCLEKPKSQTRKSSVPVIRITRPRSPDSDSDSDDGGLGARKREDSFGSVGSSGTDSAVTTSPRAGRSGFDTGGEDASCEGSMGSGELNMIAEEKDEPKDFETASIESKESVKSKESSKSKHSIWSRSSAKEEDSGKKKLSLKDKEKAAKNVREARKAGREPLKINRDALKDKDFSKEKPRSPVKKMLKHLKRSVSTSSSSTAMAERGDRRSSVRSNTSGESCGSNGYDSHNAAYVAHRQKAATIDSRGAAGRGGATGHRSATGEVIGHDVRQARGKSATLDHRKARNDVRNAMGADDDSGPRSPAWSGSRERSSTEGSEDTAGKDARKARAWKMAKTPALDGEDLDDYELSSCTPDERERNSTSTSDGKASSKETISCRRGSKHCGTEDEDADCSSPEKCEPGSGRCCEPATSPPKPAPDEVVFRSPKCTELPGVGGGPAGAPGSPETPAASTEGACESPARRAAGGAGKVAASQPDPDMTSWLLTCLPSLIACALAALAQRPPPFYVLMSFTHELIIY